MKPIPIIFCAYFFSLLGDSLFKIAFPLFIYARTDSSIYTSLSYATLHAPYILIMPFMGGLVDRISKKRLLLSTDALSTVCMSTLAFYSICVVSWSFPILPLFLLLFLVVSIDTLNHPAFHAFVPHIVSSARLPKINSGMGVMSNVLTVAGRLAGGTLVMYIGAVSVFGINALSFIFSFAFIVLLPQDNAPPRIKGGTKRVATLFTDLKKSVRYTFTNDIGRFFTIFHFFCNLGITLILGGMIYFLADILMLSSAHVGLVMALAGLGSVVGSFITPMLMKKVSHGTLFICDSFFIACAVLSFAWADTAVKAFLSLFVLNAVTGVIIVLTFTIRQQRIPKEHLGKTIVITRPVAFAPIPLSSMVVGYVLGKYNTVVPLALAGFCILFIAFLVSIKTRFVRLANTKLKPS